MNKVKRTSKSDNMKKILIMPDSFKGTMGADEVAQIMTRAIMDVSSDIRTLSLPISDGGEGFLEFYKRTHLGCEEKFHEVHDESMEIKKVPYLVYEGKAIIESASIFGLPQAKSDVMNRTSFGLGEMIKLLTKDTSIKQIVISVGGTSTVDMGLGLLKAMGAQFKDVKGNEVFPYPSNLSDIETFDFSKLSDTHEILVLSDVSNPLYGETGGLSVYSNQKGAKDKDIEYLKVQGQRFFDKEQDKLHYGAGGGVVLALAYFLNGTVQSGMKFVLESLELDQILKDVDCVYTGEGALDYQSFHGKAIGILYEECFKNKIPLFAFAGQIKLVNQFHKENLYCIPIHQNKEDYENFEDTSKDNLYKTVKMITKLIVE